MIPLRLIPRFIQHTFANYGPRITKETATLRLFKESSLVNAAANNFKNNAVKHTQNLNDHRALFALFPDSDKDFKPTGSETLSLENYKQEFWSDYTKKSHPLNQFGIKVLTSSTSPGLTVELGCGNSQLVVDLLANGGKVIALDSCQAALTNLENKINKIGLTTLQKRKLTLVHFTAEEYTFPKKVNLIYAQSSFSYFNPAKFEKLWDTMYDSLEKDGRIAGDFFTRPLDKDTEHNGRELFGMWFTDKRTIEALSKDKYDIEHLELSQSLKKTGGTINFIGRKK